MTGSVERLLMEHLDTWTAAVETRSAAGRGSSKKLKLVGIQKLRELILELAVRGQLVSQDESDEPASVLLERIAVERERLVKEKKIKKPKKLPEVSDDEKPFDLPKGWAWSRLNNLGEWGAGATPRRGDSELYGGDIPWFKSGELNSDYISESDETITELALKKSSLRYNKVGDVLVAMYGATIGKTSILSVRATTNQAVCACTLFDGILNTYLLTLLKAYKPRLIGMGAGGAQPNISREKIISTVVAVPPKEEQKRIVTKVDELMALCDDLEQEQENSIAAHVSLVENLLAALTNAANQGEFKQAWVRVAEHFDILFTTGQSVEQLKQTILQLAVMGKLVEQDPTDEPASVLLERIAAEKKRLVEEKVIKKQKVLPEISDEEKVFELPEGWAWCRLGDVAFSTEYGLSEKTSQGVSGVPVLAMGNIQDGVVYPTDNKVVSPTTKGLPGLYLKNRDLLYNRTNSAELVGKTGLFTGADNVYTFASYLIRINLDKNTPLPEFVNTNMLTSLFRLTQIDPHLKQQCGQANVNGTIMKNMVIPIAPEREQIRILNRLEQLLSLCFQLKEKVSKSNSVKVNLAGSLVERAVL